MKRILVIMLSLALLLTCGLFIAGCGEEEVAPVVSETEVEVIDIYDTAEAVELNMSVFYNNSVYMTYTVDGSSGKPQAEYAAANGKTYREGDFKPVWEELQSRLNFSIKDITPTDAKNVSAAYTTWEALGFEGVDIMVAPAAKVNDEAVTNGTFLALNEYLDLMPNFSKFLDENEIVKLTITAGDGNIYYAPYFDGYDDVERMIMLRSDWVKKLLDTDGAYDTATEMDETFYTPYMPVVGDYKLTVANSAGNGTQEIAVSYDKNIILVQNELEVKNGETLTIALKDYLKTTYGDYYKNLSDIFIGQDACYNADELVALMRCVCANTEYLTGQTDNSIVGFFPRKYQMGRVAQLFSFAEIWGVKGLESRNTYLYVDDDGILYDGRFEDATYDAINRLNALYKEGLILQDFDKDESTAGLDGSEHRARLLQSNLGFITYDYNQTTTIYNTNAQDPASDKYIEGFELQAVLPPVADWDGNGKYYQFTASWRSVKTDCWTILSSVADDEQKLYRALALFDYLYGEEGNRLMSYGPEAWIDGTITYNGQEVPKLSAAALTELDELANGNYTNYYRMWLGATFPIGYVKQQGMEFQTVPETGKIGLEYILNACNLGTMKHLVVTVENEGDLWLVPTTFALTKEEINLISDNCADLTTAFQSGNNDTDRIIWVDYVIYGFGGKNANGDTLKTEDELVAYLYNDCGGKVFLNCYRDAYDRMLEAIAESEEVVTATDVAA